METILYNIQTETTGWEFLLQVISCFLCFNKDLIILLMSVELAFLTVYLEIIEISTILDEISGQILVLFILTISACEIAIALAMFLSSYKSRGTLRETDLAYLKG